MIIYHITPRNDWEKAKPVGAYTAELLSQEGFIHCSTQQQIVGTANFLFKGQQNLALLCIDTERVKPEIRFESASNTDQKFPHIYGPLNLDAVVDVVDFPAQPDGTFELPSELQGRD